MCKYCAIASSVDFSAMLNVLHGLRYLAVCCDWGCKNLKLFFVNFMKGLDKRFIPNLINDSIDDRNMVQNELMQKDWYPICSDMTVENEEL